MSTMSQLMMQLVMSSHVLHTRYATTSPTTSPSLATTSLMTPPSSSDREDRVHVKNVHKLTVKGQGEWPVAGAEETVMQSTVIINCTRGRGGFNFD